MIIVPITGLLWEIKNPLGRRAEKVLKRSIGNEPSRLRVLRAKKELFLFFRAILFQSSCVTFLLKDKQRSTA